MILRVHDEIQNAKENMVIQKIDNCITCNVAKSINQTFHVAANLWVGSASDRAIWWRIWCVNRTITFTDIGKQKQQHLFDAMMVLIQIKTLALISEGKHGGMEGGQPTPFTVRLKSETVNVKVTNSHHGWNETLFEPRRPICLSSSLEFTTNYVRRVQLICKYERW